MVTRNTIWRPRYHKIRRRSIHAGGREVFGRAFEHACSFAISGPSSTISSQSLQATYKAYRDGETGDSAPISMIVGELGAMVVAGALNLVTDDDQTYSRFPSGMENSAIALTYLVYHLALREDASKIMRTEVSTVDIQAEDLVDTLRQLP